MTYKVKVTHSMEYAYLDAMASVRRAMRAGDLVKAERWLRLAERYRKLEALEDQAADKRAAKRRAHWDAEAAHAAKMRALGDGA